MNPNLRNLIQLAAVICATACATSNVFGLGSDYRNGEIVGGTSAWPSGLKDLVNTTNRVHGFFVNAEDVFFFSGSATNFNDFLRDYSRLEGIKQHRVVLHEGIGEAGSPWDKQGKPCDWKLVAGPESWLTQNPKQSNFILEVHFWTGGKIALDQVVVPKNVEVANATRVISKTTVASRPYAVILSSDRLVFAKAADVVIHEEIRNLGTKTIENVPELDWGMSIVWDGKEYKRDPKYIGDWNGPGQILPKSSFASVFSLSEYLIPPEALTAGRHTIALKDAVMESNSLTLLFSPEAQSVLDGLNGKAAAPVWQSAIDIIERPESRPTNTVDSGEVTAFVSDCKQRLAKLGVQVKWNSSTKRYEAALERQTEVSANALTYRDPASGITFTVESDRRHVVAVDKDGKVLWRRQPGLDGNLPPYSDSRPLPNPAIVWIGALGKHESEQRRKAFIGVSFNSRQGGMLDLKTGDFTFQGQD